MKKEVREWAFLLSANSVLAGALFGWKAFVVTAVFCILLFSKIRKHLPLKKIIVDEELIEADVVEVPVVLNPKKTKARISEAMKSGEIIQIRYYSGSSPGELREITPIRFEKAEKVKAFCHRSKLNKSFFLDKILIDEMDEAG